MRRKNTTTDGIKTVALVALTKSILFGIRSLKIGHGATWPGHIALKLEKNFVDVLLQKNKHLKTILIVGTNGKTTCAKLLTHVLTKNGHKTFSNTTGANLLNGITSTLINNANIFGQIKADVAILEVDENALPQCLKQFEPTAILALNLFRDQLDRYGEIDAIRDKWEKSIVGLSPAPQIFLNGQDPNLFFLGQKLLQKVNYFGISEEQIEKNDTTSIEADATYCPICLSSLSFSCIAYSHIGVFSCDHCGGNAGEITDLSKNIVSPLSGTFNRYNLSAVALVLKKIFQIEPEKINADIEDFLPAFGRQEIIEYQGRKIWIQLSKNPVGFNQSIDLIVNSKEKNKKVLLLLNDAIPDGRDVSWIWDVNYERLVDNTDKVWIAGGRAYDMAIRIKYAMRENSQNSRKTSFDEKIIADESITKILSTVISASEAGETIFVLPVYSQMLELRKILTGDSMEIKK
ncbi:MAG: MurT ligase domain-containing protein [Candidatus Berkelbacteria bacterium]